VINECYDQICAKQGLMRGVRYRNNELCEARWLLTVLTRGKNPIDWEHSSPNLAILNISFALNIALLVQSNLVICVFFHDYG
jgi:hypothetical protein